MSNAIAKQLVGLKTAKRTVYRVGILVGVTETGEVHKDIVVVGVAASRI